MSWSYNGSGTLTTNWQVSATDLRTGAATTDVLQGVIPHHYRRNTGNKANGTITDLSFFGSNSYLTPRGKLKLVAGNSIDISYKFTGMLPWYPAPCDYEGTDDTSGHEGMGFIANAFDSDRMRSLINNYAQKGEFGSDTYWGGKGLTQMALNMAFAREMGHEELFGQCHDRLKEVLVDWLTYTPGEDNFFFARDPRYGGLIGYATSFDSDTYNDHHFHYGYYTLASALLCMVDDDFKQNYGEMVKLIARDYNNYKRDDWACFLRMMDPWAGHCYAGGLGDGAGNGQESTSESMQAWGGMYLLGVALGDDELRDAGIFGWVSESRATAEYWFDRHGETVGSDYHTTAPDYDADNIDNLYNIDYTKFKHTRDGVVDYTQPWSSNLTSHGIGWWTWFGGDPVFMQGIQWMPISPALDYLGEDKSFAEWDYQRLMQIKEHVGWEDYSGSNAWLGNSDWGNVVLTYRQWSDADDAAAIFDEGWTKGWGTMTTSTTNGITYYVTHSHRTYGDIVWDVTADYPTARVYDKNGVKTHIAYNPTDVPITVNYSDGTTLTVPARQLKVEGVESAACNYVYPVDDSEPDLRERLAMKNLALGKTCTASSYENDGSKPVGATDGRQDTRWGSSHQDDEWIEVDLGESTSIYKVRIRWEAAYASEYRIELRDTENGAVTFSKTGTGKSNDWTELSMNDNNGRYLRLIGVRRGTQYGTSLYELEVYGRPQSAANTDLMGVEISCAKSVLKQDEPTALTIQGYDYAKQSKSVTATWSSTDGTFEGSTFTPTKYGNVSVTAVVDAMTATKTLPVEEALRLSRLDLHIPAAMVVSRSYPFSVEGKDQFGAPIAISPTYDTTLQLDAVNHTLQAAATGQYTVEVRQGSVVTTAPVLVISDAPAAPTSFDGKVKIFVGEEVPPMSFAWNGASEQVGDIFALTDDCQALFVRKLGTCGFGALGDIDLQGANMIHADVYPLADAPQFSIHIEGAPGNREYANRLTGGQWNSIDMPISNTTANWVFLAFSNYAAGTGQALIANVYFYTQTDNMVYIGTPDSKGIATVTTFGAGVTDANKAQFLADLAALPATTTAVDLSAATLGNSEPMTITTQNPNVILLLNGDGGDDNAASTQEAMLTNNQNTAYTGDGIWYLPLKNTNYRIVLQDGYPVLPVNFGRNTSLSYTRTIAAGAYATSCLPRSVAIPAGLTAYTLSSADGKITFTKVNTGTMEANKPYLLRNTTTGDVVLTITNSTGDTFLSAKPDDMKTEADGVSMLGNYQQFQVTGTEGYAAFRSNGSLAWLSNSGTTVGSFRAYLTGITSEQLARGVFFNDVTTGVGEALKVKSETFTAVPAYNLAGQRVTQPTAKGLYIINGKKVVAR